MKVNKKYKLKKYKISIKKKIKLYNILFTFNIKNVRISFCDINGNIIFKLSNSKYGSTNIHTYENLRKLIKKIKEYNIKIKLYNKYKLNILFNGMLRGRNYLKRALYKEKVNLKINSFIEIFDIMHNGVKQKKIRRK